MRGLVMVGVLLSGMTAAAQVGDPWREALEYLPLLAPAGVRNAAYRVYVSPLDLETTLRRLAADPSLVRALGAWQPRPMLVLGGGLVISLATWAGWKLINEPKVIYFSNLLDRPRPEIWAGFLLAALALVGYLAWQGRMQPALRFAVAGFIISRIFGES